MDRDSKCVSDLEGGAFKYNVYTGGGSWNGKCYWTAKEARQECASWSGQHSQRGVFATLHTPAMAFPAVNFR